MANFVAHALGRPDVLSNSNVFFTSMSLPPLVKKAWERDVYIYIYTTTIKHIVLLTLVHKVHYSF